VTQSEVHDIGRIPVIDVTPGPPAKAYAGEAVPFEATVFREGHGLVGARLLLTDPTGRTADHAMLSLGEGTDRWRALVRLDSEGEWSYRVRGHSDDFGSWRHDAELKVPAGVDVELTFLVGAGILSRGAADTGRTPAQRRLLRSAAELISDGTRPADERLAAAAEARLAEVLAAHPIARLSSLSPARTILVERTRAGVGSWYEFFPRSIGAKRGRDGKWRSGTFRTAERRLPGIAAMGFDVVYLPPVHPIGLSFRKGPNNTLTATPNDPGSPWAIGSAEGGHDAIHPDLGTLDDFTHFVKAAQKNGLEVALDLALQCSPDHPWVAEHPEWFTTLPDGSIAYAENPPKKYQDIYPLDFDNDPVGLREEVLRIVRHWIGLGVAIFRVDNPHTKPVEFWRWLLAEVRRDHPEVVFLAEAFTRPAMLQTLAKIGFQQSYTYFTWRNTKQELADYLSELSHETSAFLRPNLFVNTPDILTEYLQFGGVPAYKVRAAIAATASPSWGVYSGYELIENVARPGSEENIDNEKYEYKPRDFDAAEREGRSIAPYLRMLNQARREHPALRQLRNLQLHHSDDDAILVYSKHLPGRLIGDGTGPDDTVIVVANVDPHSVRETMVHLDTAALGIASGTRFSVTDLVTQQAFTWGGDDYVRLDAFHEPVHILRVDVPRS